MRFQKFIIIPILVFGVFVFYNSGYRDGNSRASIWANEEREFFKPIEVVWRGEIISTMANGVCIGLKGEFGGYYKAMACLPSQEVINSDSAELWKFEGTVTVTGKWTGITCAYKNTIFGECIPDVIIDEVSFTKDF